MGANLLLGSNSADELADDASYVAPADDYGVPYEPPVNSYGAPAVTYEEPAPSYENPAYEAPAPAQSMSPHLQLMSLLPSTHTGHPRLTHCRHTSQQDTNLILVSAVPS